MYANGNTTKKREKNWKKILLSCVDGAIENDKGPTFKLWFFHVVHEGKVKWPELKVRDCSKSTMHALKGRNYSNVLSCGCFCVLEFVSWSLTKAAQHQGLLLTNFMRWVHLTDFELIWSNGCIYYIHYRWILEEKNSSSLDLVVANKL